MKRNLPVTDVEREMKNGSILVSKTDLKGKITYCNRDFCEIAGFSFAELEGRAHNIIRHPDMPPAAFQELWDTVRAGKPWSGVVKNRCKNGDFYWVTANVIPITRAGHIVEYMSVRTKPARASILAAETLYRNVNAGKASLTPSLWKHLSSALGRVKAAYWLVALVLMAVVPQAWEAAEFFGVDSSTIAMGTLLALSLGAALVWRIMAPTAYAAKKLRQMAEGEYFDWTQCDRNDELGALLKSIRMAQVKLGFDVMDAREKAEEGARLYAALDQVSNNVMMTDRNCCVVYANEAQRRTFQGLQDILRDEFPDFRANDLLGTNMNMFSDSFGIANGSLGELSSRASYDLQLGGRSMKIIINPILDKQRARIGSVVEWNDITEQLQAEDAIVALVDGAKNGDLSRRASTKGQEGFHLRVSQGMNAVMETVSRVLGDLSGSMGAMADGDLSRELTGDYDGTYGEMKEAVNRTLDTLRTTVANIQNTADVIDESSREIASGNLNLSTRAEQQAADLVLTASSLEELTATVRNNADNAQLATTLSSEARGSAEEAGGVMEQAELAMREINKASSKIAEIIGMIDEIAFQTNLLSLNASVEAARAGEHGRGFSVVATEVGHLAKRSAEAARQIKTLINDSVKKVSVGAELVGESGRSLVEIVESVGKVGDLIEDIAHASREQSIGLDHINRAVISMDRVTQQNAALAEEATATSITMSERSMEMSSMVSSFKLQ